MAPSEPLSPPAEGLGTPARDLTAAELVFANRLITLELVLPNVTHEINNALQVIGGLGEIIANLGIKREDGHRSILSAPVERLWPTRDDFRRAWPAVLRGTGIGSIGHRRPVCPGCVLSRKSGFFRDPNVRTTTVGC